VRERLEYTGDQKLSGVGFELKDKGEHYDRKQNMHLTRETGADLLALADKTGDEGTFRRFIESVLVLPELLAPIVLDYAEQCESLGVVGFREDVDRCKEKWMFRYLHYFGGSAAGDDIAKAHVDKGGFTAHLFETDDGLQYLDAERIWRPMPVSSEETIIIPGLRLQHRSENRLIATCHKVVANEQTAHNGRYSAVCFIDFLNGRFFDKKKFGAMQDFPEGHFYEMPFNTLDAFFID
jgi:hypothetical protein